MQPVHMPTGLDDDHQFWTVGFHTKRRGAHIAGSQALQPDLRVSPLECDARALKDRDGLVMSVLAISGQFCRHSYLGGQRLCEAASPRHAEMVVVEVVRPALWRHHLAASAGTEHGSRRDNAHVGQSRQPLNELERSQVVAAVV